MTQAFLGGAGTGKTHCLMERAAETCAGHTWRAGERLLALTFMHGSRRRMEERLAALRSAGVRVECETLDSLALRLVRQCRRYFGTDKRISPSGVAADPWTDNGTSVTAGFAALRTAAASLLRRPALAAWFRSGYPIVIVDEVQDCRAELLDLLQALCGATHVLCAGDAFQVLDSDDHRAPAIQWLSDNAECEHLERIWRTDNPAVLGAARALRAGEPISESDIVVGVQGPGLAAWEIARRIAWEGWTDQTALISPAGPQNQFVRQTLTSLEGALGKKRKIGPYPFTWESAFDTAANDFSHSLWARLGGGATASVGQLRAVAREADDAVGAVLMRARKTIMLIGRTEVTRGEFEQIARQDFHRKHHFSGLLRTPRRVGMTVHSAKNREFLNVIVLWPYQVPGNDEHKRRLLYNAITRARLQAVVILQGGTARVANDPLFG